MTNAIFTGIVFSLIVGNSWADLLADVTAKESSVAKLRQEVTAMAKPVMVNNADLRTFVSLTPLVQAVSKLNEMSAEARTIKIASTSRNGYLWRDTGDWCGSYVELNTPDTLQATAVMSNFSAIPSDNGIVRVGTRIVVNGGFQAKFHLAGRRVRFPGGNFCTPGGGAGSSAWVSFTKVEDFEVDLKFSRSSDGWSLDYSAAFVRPDQFKVTADISLEILGTIGHPMAFDLPKAPLMSGSMPLLLTNEGTFQVPGEKVPRAYSLVLTPATFTVTSAGVLAAWKTTVQFKNKPGNAS